MKRLVPLVIRPWMLPLIVAALAVPIVAGFAVAGPPLGLTLGAVAVAVLLIAAATARYDEPIEAASAPDSRYRVMVVAEGPVDSPDVIERIVAIADEGRAVLDRDQPPHLLIVAPARVSLMDRWA